MNYELEYLIPDSKFLILVLWGRRIMASPALREGRGSYSGLLCNLYIYYKVIKTKDFISGAQIM